MRIEPAPTHSVFSLLPLVIGDHLRFEAKFPGVAIAVLYRDETTGSSAALLRYEPGGRVPQHRHMGFEHIYVLEGVQVDERGEYPAGTLVINPPGTEHSVISRTGCLVLAIWQRPVQFVGAL